MGKLFESLKAALEEVIAHKQGESDLCVISIEIPEPVEEDIAQVFLEDIKVDNKK